MPITIHPQREQLKLKLLRILDRGTQPAVETQTEGQQQGGDSFIENDQLGQACTSSKSSQLIYYSSGLETLSHQTQPTAPAAYDQSATEEDDDGLPISGNHASRLYLNGIYKRTFDMAIASMLLECGKFKITRRGQTNNPDALDSAILDFDDPAMAAKAYAIAGGRPITDCEGRCMVLSFMKDIERDPIPKAETIIVTFQGSSMMPGRLYGICVEYGPIYKISIGIDTTKYPFSSIPTTNSSCIANSASNTAYIRFYKPAHAISCANALRNKDIQGYIFQVNNWKIFEEKMGFRSQETPETGKSESPDAITLSDQPNSIMDFEGQKTKTTINIAQGVYIVSERERLLSNVKAIDFLNAEKIVSLLETLPFPERNMVLFDPKLLQKKVYEAQRIIYDQAQSRHNTLSFLEEPPNMSDATPATNFDGYFIAPIGREEHDTMESSFEFYDHLDDVPVHHKILEDLLSEEPLNEALENYTEEYSKPNNNGHRPKLVPTEVTEEPKLASMKVLEKRDAPKSGGAIDSPTGDKSYASPESSSSVFSKKNTALFTNASLFSSPYNFKSRKSRVPSPVSTSAITTLEIIQDRSLASPSISDVTKNTTAYPPVVPLEQTRGSTPESKPQLTPADCRLMTANDIALQLIVKEKQHSKLDMLAELSKFMLDISHLTLNERKQVLGQRLFTTLRNETGARKHQNLVIKMLDNENLDALSQLIAYPEHLKGLAQKYR